MARYFNNQMSLEEVKTTYKKLALKFHPDMGGSVEDMAELNNQFEIAFASAKKFSSNKKESSSEYVRNFYTQNGWKGSRFDISLSNTDIAKKIREYVKYVYPTYKFSITCHSYLSITVSLMEYPVELTNYDLMKNYCEKTNVKFWMNNEYKYFFECSEAEKKEIIDYQINEVNYKQLNQYYLERDSWMNPVVHNVLKDINDFIKSYHYDDSDAMIDYFDTNFYYNINIGKWDKPAKFVERTARISPNKETKAKRIA